MINILFSARDDLWNEYRAPLQAALEANNLSVDLSREHDPASVDYIVFAPNGPVSDFSDFTRCKAALGLWAGVETIVDNPTLSMPLARMVDHGLTQGMVEWVVGHTLRHHLGMDRHILVQDGTWSEEFPPLASQRPVTVLGLGTLGAACGQALAALGFPLTGWSRTPKNIEGLACTAGDDGLHDALHDAEILILLLPHTPQTESILDARTLGLLPAGAVIINPGRGALIDDDALLDALDSGQIGHATLDTFRSEPLPPEHPYWNDSKVTVTPHIASTTRPETAAQVIAENVKRGEAGEPLLHLVDRNAGY